MADLPQPPTQDVHHRQLRDLSFIVLPRASIAPIDKESFRASFFSTRDFIEFGCMKSRFTDFGFGTPALLATFTVAFAVNSLADTNIFNNGIWVIDGASDTGPNSRDIIVTVDGAPAGSFSELKVDRKSVV